MVGCTALCFFGSGWAVDERPCCTLSSSGVASYRDIAYAQTINTKMSHSDFTPHLVPTVEEDEFIDVEVCIGRISSSMTGLFSEVGRNLHIFAGADAPLSLSGSSRYGRLRLVGLVIPAMVDGGGRSCYCGGCDKWFGVWQEGEKKSGIDFSPF